MEIIRIPVLSDNYIFLLYHPLDQIAAVIDPAVAEPVLQKLQGLNARLVSIFNTHHHSDHIGGNRALMEAYPDLTIYGSEVDRGRIPEQKVFLKEGDQVSFGDRTAMVYFIPGHTRAHIAYYFPPIKEGEVGELFCGDTMFSGGCGRLFEGTPAQMVESLTKLRQLPDQTRVWCAHEYTLSNFKFAISVLPNDSYVMDRYETVKSMRSQNIPTIPSTIEIEKQSNLFLRWDDPTLQSALKTDDPVRTFGKLRGMKDLF